MASEHDVPVLNGRDSPNKRPRGLLDPYEVPDSPPEPKRQRLPTFPRASTAFYRPPKKPSKATNTHTVGQATRNGHSSKGQLPANGQQGPQPLNQPHRRPRTARPPQAANVPLPNIQPRTFPAINQKAVLKSNGIEEWESAPTLNQYPQYTPGRGYGTTADTVERRRSSAASSSAIGIPEDRTLRIRDLLGDAAPAAIQVEEERASASTNGILAAGTTAPGATMTAPTAAMGTPGRHDTQPALTLTQPMLPPPPPSMTLYSSPYEYPHASALRPVTAGGSPSTPIFFRLVPNPNASAIALNASIPPSPASELPPDIALSPINTIRPSPLARANPHLQSNPLLLSQNNSSILKNATVPPAATLQVQVNPLLAGNAPNTEAGMVKAPTEAMHSIARRYSDYKVREFAVVGSPEVRQIRVLMPGRVGLAEETQKGGSAEGSASTGESTALSSTHRAGSPCRSADSGAVPTAANEVSHPLSENSKDDSRDESRRGSPAAVDNNNGARSTSTVAQKPSTTTAMNASTSSLRDADFAHLPPGALARRISTATLNEGIFAADPRSARSTPTSRSHSRPRLRDSPVVNGAAEGVAGPQGVTATPLAEAEMIVQNIQTASNALQEASSSRPSPTCTPQPQLSTLQPQSDAIATPLPLNPLYTPHDASQTPILADLFAFPTSPIPGLRISITSPYTSYGRAPSNSIQFYYPDDEALASWVPEWAFKVCLWRPGHPVQGENGNNLAVLDDQARFYISTEAGCGLIVNGVVMTTLTSIAADSSPSSRPKRLWGEIRHGDEIGLITMVPSSAGGWTRRDLMLQFHCYFGVSRRPRQPGDGGPFRMLEDRALLEGLDAAVGGWEVGRRRARRADRGAGTTAEKGVEEVQTMDLTGTGAESILPSQAGASIETALELNDDDHEAVVIDEPVLDEAIIQSPEPAAQSLRAVDAMDVDAADDLPLAESADPHQVTNGIQSEQRSTLTPLSSSSGLEGKDRRIERESTEVVHAMAEAIGKTLTPGEIDTMENAANTLRDLINRVRDSEEGQSAMNSLQDIVSRMADSREGQGVDRVRDIRGHRVADDGTTEFLIRWHENNRANSWESEEQLKPTQVAEYFRYLVYTRVGTDTLLTPFVEPILVDPAAQRERAREEANSRLRRSARGRRGPAWDPLPHEMQRIHDDTIRERVRRNSLRDEAAGGQRGDTPTALPARRGPGRPRKISSATPSSAVQPQDEPLKEQELEELELKELESTTAVVSVKKRPGRPRKDSTATPASTTQRRDEPFGEQEITPAAVSAKRKPGRPRKESTATPASTAKPRNEPSEKHKVDTPTVVSAKRAPGRPRKDSTATPASTAQRRDEPSEPLMEQEYTPTVASAKRGPGRPRKESTATPATAAKPSATAILPPAILPPTKNAKSPAAFRRMASEAQVNNSTPSAQASPAFRPIADKETAAAVRRESFSRMGSARSTPVQTPTAAKSSAASRKSASKAQVNGTTLSQSSQDVTARRTNGEQSSAAALELATKEAILAERERKKKQQDLVPVTHVKPAVSTASKTIHATGLYRSQASRESTDAGDASTTRDPSPANGDGDEELRRKRIEAAQKAQQTRRAKLALKAENARRVSEALKAGKAKARKAAEAKEDELQNKEKGDKVMETRSRIVILPIKRKETPGKARAGRWGAGKLLPSPKLIRKETTTTSGQQEEDDDDDDDNDEEELEDEDLVARQLQAEEEARVDDGSEDDAMDVDKPPWRIPPHGIRGRWSKGATETPEIADSNREDDGEDDEDAQPIKRGRGRPAREMRAATAENEVRKLDRVPKRGESNEDEQEVVEIGSSESSDSNSSAHDEEYETASDSGAESQSEQASSPEPGKRGAGRPPRREASTAARRSRRVVSKRPRRAVQPTIAMRMKTQARRTRGKAPPRLPGEIVLPWKKGGGGGTVPPGESTASPKSDKGKGKEEAISLDSDSGEEMVDAPSDPPAPTTPKKGARFLGSKKPYAGPMRRLGPPPGWRARLVARHTKDPQAAVNHDQSSSSEAEGEDVKDENDEDVYEDDQEEEEVRTRPRRETRNITPKYHDALRYDDLGDGPLLPALHKRLRKSPTNSKSPSKARSSPAIAIARTMTRSPAPGGSVTSTDGGNGDADGEKEKRRKRRSLVKEGWFYEVVDEDNTRFVNPVDKDARW